MPPTTNENEEAYESMMQQLQDDLSGKHGSGRQEKAIFDTFDAYIAVTLDALLVKGGGVIQTKKTGNGYSIHA